MTPMNRDTFNLDTGGTVLLPSPPGTVYSPSGATFYAASWDDLTPFEQGYTTPILEATGAAFHQLHPATLAQIREDCGRWVRDHECHAATVEAGRYLWDARQRGVMTSTLPDLSYPPLHLYLNEAGQACAERADER